MWTQSTECGTKNTTKHETGLRLWEWMKVFGIWIPSSTFKSKPLNHTKLNILQGKMVRMLIKIIKHGKKKPTTGHRQTLTFNSLLGVQRTKDKKGNKKLVTELKSKWLRGWLNSMLGSIFGNNFPEGLFILN